MDIRLKIVDGGDDGRVYWFKVVALTLAGKPIDRDIFRFPKQTKRILLNPLPDPLNPPPGWKPKLSVPRESNVFGYDTLADIATRRFLRRQNLIERHAVGLAWALADWRKTVGTDMPPLPAQMHNPFLADRLATMLGTELLVDAPDIAGKLEKLEPRPGTVTTISADFDGIVSVTPTCTDSGDNLIFGRQSLPFYHTYMRFPLGALPSPVVITDTDLVLEVSAIGGAPLFDLQAYNQDGQADPEADSCTSRRTRCEDDTSPYLDDSTLIQSTGTKTLRLPAVANTDIKAAKAAVDRFSIGGTGDTGPSGTQIVFESIEKAGSNEPRLTITHGPSAGTQGQAI